MRTRLAELLSLAVLLAAAGVLFSRNLHTATDYDEGVYLASLDALRHGQHLGSDVFASQPPGFYLLLRLLAWPFGHSVTGIRAAFLGVAVVACLSVYFLGRAVGGRWAGLGAAGLLAIAPPFPSEAPLVAADVPSVALALASLALAAYGFRRRGIVLPAAAGAVFALAVSVKFLAVPAVVPLAALAIWGRASRRQIAALLGGALAVLAAFLIGYAGVLGDLWHQSVTFHRSSRGVGVGEPNGHTVLHFLSFHTPFAWLVVLGLVSAVVAVWRTWPLWLFAVASGLFLLWQKPLFEHHLVLLATALAAPAGTALGSVALRVPYSAVAGLALAAVLAVGYAQQVHRIDLQQTAEPEELVWGSRCLAAVTTPGRLVASDQPIVAFRAHRVLPGALVDTSFVRLESGSLTPARILETIDHDHIPAVVAGRSFLIEPKLLVGLRARFTRHLVHHGVTLFLAPRFGSRAAPASAPGSCSGRRASR
jgi:4-amino-4-deoxy-L-arabinose transferase-like glycosyltransferase